MLENRLYIQVLEIMVTTRRGTDLARSSHKKQRAHNVGREASESLSSGIILGDCRHDVFTKLSDEVASDLSKSVTSLALSNGYTVLFACSGIAIERQGHMTRFLTSASLVKALNATKKLHDNLKIEVRVGGNEVHQGYLAEYDLDQNFAVVNVITFLDVHVVLLKCAEQILPDSNVVAIRRDISGKLIATSVTLADDFSNLVDREELIPYRYDPEVWEGGPLFDFDGNFVGMNVILIMERTFFLPWRVLVKELELICSSLQKRKFVPHLETSEAVRLYERPVADISNCHPEGAFGDVFAQDIWMELTKRASSKIQSNVVALASFHGETLFFACTGFCIKWNKCKTILTSASLVRSSGYENKIEENLRIEVYIDERRTQVEGTLQHCSLHYNVALVSVKEYHPLRPAKIRHDYFICSKVAAVGRCFRSGKLMAASGVLVDWTGTLDCRLLVRSSCKISKVGIGGPLVTFDGEVIGMNFYDKKIGTPFLLWKEILDILAHFKDTVERTSVGASNGGDPTGIPFWKMVGDDSDRPNRWPVPGCRRRDSSGEGESEDEDGSDDEDESDGVGKYTYRNGIRFELL